MRSKTIRLKNGVRLMTIPMKDNPVVTVMVITEAGTIDEKKEKHGLAHFLEHMAMKGGEKYATPYAVSSTLDAVGAVSNAFTGQELTGYWAKGNPKHFETILDVVSDVYLSARIDESEIKKELGVIVEEINMYHDMPQAYVQDLFYAVAYGDQPAGRHPLGTKGTVSALERKDFLSFMEEHYVAENTLVVVSGSFDQKVVEREVKERFGDISTKKPRQHPKTKDTQKQPNLHVEDRKTDQLHFNLGVKTFKASDRRSPALAVLNSVLSGGMSGRLFQKLREEMGVCYYVRSSVEQNRDSGLLIVKAGVDTNRLLEVVDVVVAELKRLCDEEVEAKELKKAKDYLVGHTFLGLESSEGVADFFVEQEVLIGEQKTPQQVAKEIKAVTAKDVRKLARQMCTDSRLSMAVVGRVKDRQALTKKLRF